MASTINSTSAKWSFREAAEEILSARDKIQELVEGLKSVVQIYELDEIKSFKIIETKLFTIHDNARPLLGGVEVSLNLISNSEKCKEVAEIYSKKAKEFGLFSQERRSFNELKKQILKMQTQELFFQINVPNGKDFIERLELESAKVKQLFSKFKFTEYFTGSIRVGEYCEVSAKIAKNYKKKSGIVQLKIDNQTIQLIHVEHTSLPDYSRRADECKKLSEVYKSEITRITGDSKSLNLPQTKIQLAILNILAKKVEQAHQKWSSLADKYNNYFAVEVIEPPAAKIVEKIRYDDPRLRSFPWTFFERKDIAQCISYLASLKDVPVVEDVIPSMPRIVKRWHFENLTILLSHYSTKKSCENQAKKISDYAFSFHQLKQELKKCVKIPNPKPEPFVLRDRSVVKANQSFLSFVYEFGMMFLGHRQDPFDLEERRRSELWFEKAFEYNYRYIEYETLKKVVKSCTGAFVKYQKMAEDLRSSKKSWLKVQLIYHESFGPPPKPRDFPFLVYNEVTREFDRLDNNSFITKSTIDSLSSSTPVLDDIHDTVVFFRQDSDALAFQKNGYKTYWKN